MKFRITIIEQSSNKVVSEIQEHSTFPNAYTPLSLYCGRSGTPISVERVFVPDKMDQYDSTEVV